MKQDYSKTNLDDFEKEYNYELRYVKSFEIEETLNNSMDENSKNKNVYPEIIDVINIYINNSKRK